MPDSGQDPIVFSHRSKWLTLLALPFFAAGALPITVGVATQFFHLGQAKPGAGWALMALGVISIVAGASVITVRSDAVIFRESGEVITCNGMLGRYRTRQFELKSFDRVRVDYGEIRSKYSSHPRYYIRLAGESTVVRLMEYASARKAVEKAEELSRLLGKPVEVDERTRAALA